MVPPQDHPELRARAPAMMSKATKRSSSPASCLEHDLLNALVALVED
jgi:hypothetical protein